MVFGKSKLCKLSILFHRIDSRHIDKVVNATLHVHLHVWLDTNEEFICKDSSTRIHSKAYGPRPWLHPFHQYSWSRCSAQKVPNNVNNSWNPWFLCCGWHQNTTKVAPHRQSSALGREGTEQNTWLLRGPSHQRVSLAVSGFVIVRINIRLPRLVTRRTNWPIHAVQSPRGGWKGAITNKMLLPLNAPPATPVPSSRVLGGEMGF